MSNDPILAVRAASGEFFLAAETNALGDRFFVDESVYEIVGEPTRTGPGWRALVRTVEGLAPGSEFNALLWSGRKVSGDNG